jgi:hypothetical protein
MAERVGNGLADDEQLMADDEQLMSNYNDVTRVDDGLVGHLGLATVRNHIGGGGGLQRSGVGIYWKRPGAGY